jgi:hypothetical protein
VQLSQSPSFDTAVLRRCVSSHYKDCFGLDVVCFHMILLELSGPMIILTTCVFLMRRIVNIRLSMAAFTWGSLGVG